MAETQNREPRASQNRETFQRPQSWRPPEILPMPDHRPGWVHRYIRISMVGQADPANISSKLREGWEPVKAAEYPELMVHATQSGKFVGNIEVGGLLLCKIPEEFMKQRDAHYNSQNKAQMESVDNTFMRQSDPRMPLFKERSSKVTFGSGSI
jgi:hypothetical protein